MLLLAFDTATPAVTVAVHDGREVLAETTSVDGTRHGELLAPAIERVLREAEATPGDLTAVGVGVGPGPFTGLRVGLMTAGALGEALGIPVHGVCTHDVLAYASGLDEPFGVATDARRREVYWARYTNARTRVSGPGVARPNAIAAELAGLPVVGAGAVLYPDAFPCGLPPGHPAAAALARLVVERLTAGSEGGETEGGVEGGGLLPPRPLYLRRPDAAVPGQRKQVTPTAL